MHIFPRKSKSTPGAYYFGEFNDDPLAPFSISFATFDRKTYKTEPKHYHSKHQTVFITIEGEGILNVNGQEVRMIPEQMIHVEPGEITFVQEIVSNRIQFIVVLGAKENDRVIVE